VKKPASKEKPLHPICIRFRRKDLSAVRAAAAKSGEIFTVWIREAVLLRLNMIDQSLDLSTLRFETAGGYGEPVSVRFRSGAEYRRAARAATQAQQHLASWIRAVAIDQAKRIAPEAPMAKTG
jgi:hypothetical protein